MRLFCLLFILSISLNSCFFKKASSIKVEKSRSFSKIYKSTDNEMRYKAAEQFYADKKYSLAIQLYEDLFPYIKGTERYEDMYFKSANAYYFLKDYLNAENFYKSFVETFPNSKRAEDCNYLRAFCYYKQSPKFELDQTPTVKSMALMQAFINMHPTSIRVKEANEIIDKCREKLEQKEFKAAQLYYDLGFYKSAAISFENILENFIDSKSADEYKYLMIKSYLKYADLSFEEKQEERYLKVQNECTDFIERFADSKHYKEILVIKSQITNSIKNIKNEQITPTN
jgi:outer membrane protein assembly factor BamD